MPREKPNNSNSNSSPPDDTGDDDESDFGTEPKIEISTGTENASTVSPAPIASFITDHGAVVANIRTAKVESSWFPILM
jgi:hypothetical protein